MQYLYVIINIYKLYSINSIYIIYPYEKIYGERHILLVQIKELNINRLERMKFQINN